MLLLSIYVCLHVCVCVCEAERRKVPTYILLTKTFTYTEHYILKPTLVNVIAPFFSPDFFVCLF